MNLDKSSEIERFRMTSDCESSADVTREQKFDSLSRMLLVQSTDHSTE